MQKQLLRYGQELILGILLFFFRNSMAILGEKRKKIDIFAIPNHRE